MALIKCSECLKDISENAKTCPHCGNPIKKVKPKKEKKAIDKKKLKSILIVVAVLTVIGIILALVIPKVMEDMHLKEVEENCRIFTNKLQTYIDNKDYEGFDDQWFDHGDLSTNECDTIVCSCPSAWDLFLEKRILQADDFYNKGLISSAYNSLGDNYMSEYPKLKQYHDSKDLFKLISSKQKEDITGIYHSFGEWSWEYEVGGSLKFNKRIVHYASSRLSLQFDTYKDQVLISGHIASSKHPNWNSNKTIAVEWFDYRIVDNKIQLKLKTESNYDDMFEIVSLTDTELKLKLLIDTTDVNKGQVYIMKYKRT